MNDRKEESIINSLRDENGNIRNLINYPLFFKNMETGAASSYPDVYLAFILKTIIDDFGSALSPAYPDPEKRKKDFESALLKNLEFFLSQNTLMSE